MSMDRVDRERVFEARSEEATSHAHQPASLRVGRAAGLVAKVLALAVLVAAAAWAWQANRSTGPAMDMSMRVTSGGTPFPVTLAAVEHGPVAGVVVYTGSVAPFNEEDVFPRVTGRIVEMPVYPGDAVRPGQVVARLDDVELGSRVREAAASAAAAEANLAQMDADVEAARYGIAQMDRELAMATSDVTAAKKGVLQMEREVAMAEAEAEHQDLFTAQEERLYRTGASSRHDVENQRAMAASARAKVQAARAKLEQSQAMVATAEARVEAAQAKARQAQAMEASATRKRDAMAAMANMSRAQLRTAEVVRGYVTIEAPNGGYVVKRLVAPGVLVQPGMAILKIAQMDRVRLQANVGEKDLASIKVGSPVKVTPAGTGQAPITARVSSVFPFVDPGARTGVVEALVDNAGRRFLPGQYVQMEFVTGERQDALTVPRDAVERMGGKARVWVVNGDRAEPREVTTGLEGPDRIEVASGLTGAERVVARGHSGLYAGARVVSVSSSAPGEGAAAGERVAPARATGHSGGDHEVPPAPAPGHAAGSPATPPAPAGEAHAGHGTPAATPAAPPSGAAKEAAHASH